MSDQLYSWDNLKKDLHNLFGDKETALAKAGRLDHFGHQHDTAINRAMSCIMTYIDHGRDTKRENGEFSAYIKYLFTLIAESVLFAHQQSKLLIYVNKNDAGMVSFLHHGSNETRLHYLKLYVQLYEVTGIHPHGHIIQVMLDTLFTYCDDKKNNLVRFTPGDDQVIERFCELSVWSYDRLNAFRIFLDEYPQYLTYRVKQIASDIAIKLEDRHTLRAIAQDIMDAPIDSSSDPDEENCKDVRTH